MSKNQSIQERIARIIDVAAGRIPADVVIRNINLVNVFDGQIEEGVDIAFSGSQIAGIGKYDGVMVIDGKGMYAAPSLIDGTCISKVLWSFPANLPRQPLPAEREPLSQIRTR